MWARLRKILIFYGRFLPSFSKLGYYCRRLFWSAYPSDLSGRSWLVTGASGGIGRAVCLMALERGARVTAVARNADKLAALMAAAGPAAGERMRVLPCDLASMASITALVEELASRGERIDVLVNNVGVLLDDWSLTAEGFETSFATNILGHYLLTTRVVERALLADDATVINVASGGLYNVPLMVAPMNNVGGHEYNGTVAYGLHKRAQAVMTDVWNRQQKGGLRRFYTMHPGWVDTAGVQTSLPRFRKILWPLLRNPRQGADTVLWLAATRPEPAADTLWFDRAARPAHVYAATRQGDSAEKLVEFLEGCVDAATPA